MYSRRVDEQSLNIFLSLLSNRWVTKSHYSLFLLNFLKFLYFKQSIPAFSHNKLTVSAKNPLISLYRHFDTRARRTPTEQCVSLLTLKYLFNCWYLHSFKNNWLTSRLIHWKITQKLSTVRAMSHHKLTHLCNYYH